MLSLSFNVSLTLLQVLGLCYAHQVEVELRSIHQLRALVALFLKMSVGSLSLSLINTPPVN